MEKRPVDPRVDAGSTSGKLESLLNVKSQWWKTRGRRTYPRVIYDSRKLFSPTDSMKEIWLRPKH